MRWKVESERQHERQAGKKEIHNVHWFASHLLCKWNCQKSANQTAQVEKICSEFDPLLNQLLRRNSRQTSQGCFRVRQASRDCPDERIAAPPCDERDERHAQAAERNRTEFRGKQFEKTWCLFSTSLLPTFRFLDEVANNKCNCSGYQT